MGRERGALLPSVSHSLWVAQVPSQRQFSSPMDMSLPSLSSPHLFPLPAAWARSAQGHLSLISSFLPSFSHLFNYSLTYSPIQLSILPTSHPSTHPPIHPSIHPSTHTSLCSVAGTSMESDCDNIDDVSHEELFLLHIFPCVTLKATPESRTLLSHLILSF